MPIEDLYSFLLGVQVGRRIKMWDTYRKMEKPFSGRSILTEDENPILSESSVILITEEE